MTAINNHADSHQSQLKVCMPIKRSNWLYIVGKYLVCIGLCLPIMSFAAGLRNERLSTQSRTVSAPAINHTTETSITVPQSGSDDATQPAEPVAEQPIPTENADNPAVNDKLASKNPYEQLVKLAFRGRGADGIDSYTEAAALYCKAARDQNDANAEFALGWLYSHGRGVEKDDRIAALFFKKAAAQGHSKAQEWLANNTADPALAKVPACLLPDPPPAQTITADATDRDNASAEPVRPFYSKGPIYQLVAKIAPRYKIDADLAMAFIAVESGYNPKATSPKNAQGLMQLIPETAARFKVKNAYDPEQNINGGLAYLQWLLAYFEGDVQLVAAAYNAGENTVDKYNGIPPYPETRQYVKKITALYTRKFHPYRNDLMSNKSAILSKWAAVR